MLHSVLWKDKDLCNLPELNHPLKACQAAFCRSQEVVIPRSISLCWAGESVFLSALLCACWYVLAYRVRLCFGRVIYLSHHKRSVQRGMLRRVQLRLQIGTEHREIPQSWIITLWSKQQGWTYSIYFCCCPQIIGADQNQPANCSSGNTFLTSPDCLCLVSTDDINI